MHFSQGIVVYNFPAKHLRIRTSPRNNLFTNKNCNLISLAVKRADNHVIFFSTLFLLCLTDITQRRRHNTFTSILWGWSNLNKDVALALFDFIFFVCNFHITSECHKQKYNKILTVKLAAISNAPQRLFVAPRKCPFGQSYSFVHRKCRKTTMMGKKYFLLKLSAIIVRTVFASSKSSRNCHL